VRWRQGYLVSGTELAEQADQSQAVVLHMNNWLGQLADFLQATETVTSVSTHSVTSRNDIKKLNCMCMLNYDLQ